MLAHSLSALSVQLETAAALLEKDRAADAAVLVERAGRLARDGLTETRRAVERCAATRCRSASSSERSPTGTASIWAPPRT